MFQNFSFFDPSKLSTNQLNNPMQFENEAQQDINMLNLLRELAKQNSKNNLKFGSGKRSDPFWTVVNIFHL